MKKYFLATLFYSALFIQSCDLFTSNSSESRVIYNKNGATSGTVPFDEKRYKPTDVFVIAQNVANLKKDNQRLFAWNRSPSGCSDSYKLGQEYLFQFTEDSVLYAEWDLNITKIAGASSSGYNGDGIDARGAEFSIPSDLACGLDGCIYITDTNNFRIRKIDARGIIHTIAGDGILGFSGDDGPALSARIGAPISITINKSGTIYFSEYDRIRRIDSNGIIKTIAGGGSDSGEDIIATNAAIRNPKGLACDSLGALYFIIGNKIKKISIDGKLNTIAGSDAYGYAGDGGLAEKALFNGPSDLNLDSSDCIYVSDLYNQVVRKIDRNGIISTISGTTLDHGVDPQYEGPVVNCPLSKPDGIIVDNLGNVIIYDGGTIKNINSNGQIYSIAGCTLDEADNGRAKSAGFYSFGKLAVNSLNHIFVLEADPDWTLIRKLY